MATSRGNNSSLYSDYLIEKEIKQYIAEINHILVFVQSFIVISGLLGNILALIIINKKALRNTSSAVFITYMAIFDSAVLLFHAANLARPRRNLFIHCSLTYLTDLCTFCANWVLVIITLERCVAVSSPFLARRFCTVYSARYSIYILLTGAIIFFSSIFPLIYDTNPISNRKKCHIRSGMELIPRIYQPILFYAIPDLLLLSNLYTIYTLIRRRQEQKQRSSSLTDSSEMRITDVHSNRKQRQLTIMLVTVSLAFYLFTTPGTIMYIAELSPTNHRDINRMKRRFFSSQISVLLMQLNNATNFIFYCFAGQRFRQATAQTFNKYLTNLKVFYHRYILCDKHYGITQNNQVGNTTTFTNISQSTKFRNRTSTL